ncbi:MAG: tRNA (5-methylaminomethyl-2-thiouridine)(34)-methyltransferase MnmD [Bacteroidales bacterium]|nr:tRNA (5-methylaminomethyl-2-thiouridine)(34)-methyltransferase MnmD [Bacteroidales bacterium]
MKQTLRIVVTEDGSTTFFSPDYQEHFHSISGAVGESQHVFIKQGFVPKATQKKIVRILEVGFGTGLNMVLTSLEAKKMGVKVHYIGIEPHLLHWTEVSKLNYADILNNEEVREILMKAFTSNYVVPRYMNDNLVLQILQAPLEEVSLKQLSFDVVYFDAFSPSAQPSLWTQDVFRKIFEAMQFEGFLVTYVSKGEVRRNLESIGFIVERLSGFGKKREMLRAIKPLAKIHEHQTSKDECSKY